MTAKAMPPPMELPPDLQVTYANLVRITHTPAELIFDFAQLMPGTSGARVMARILMSPVGAKLFYRALGENLARYESTFGDINLPRGDTSLANDLFRSIHPPENPPEENK